MHLLATTAGVIDGGAEAMDLGQSPASIIIISAADSELASLARAHDAAEFGSNTLRLANLMQLGHNLSVDLYCERTASKARIIVARILGGRGYWSYGVDRLCELARDSGLKLILLPGDGEPDPALTARSSVPAADCERLRRYLVEGGAVNAGHALAFLRFLIGDGPEPPLPENIPKAGPYTGTLLSHKPDRPAAFILFYRSLLEGGQTAPVDALCAALDREGLNAFPIFIASLKDAASLAAISAQADAQPPAIILNATGFATQGADGSGSNPLAAFDCPVLQVVFSGMSEESWQASAQGLHARDLAMNVVMPELDGRIMTRAVSFKTAAQRHDATQCNIVTYREKQDRIRFVAELARRWTDLRRTPATERRIALVLANYPNRDGRIGNGVGFDTPASTLTILRALQSAGYDTGSLPQTGNDIIETLQHGPTNSGLRGTSTARLSLTDYESALARLAPSIRARITERWGEAARDPFVADGQFHLPVITYGRIAVGIQPARGYNIDPSETYHDPALVPPHGYLAFYIWLRDYFAAQAIIHTGKHGNLEWLPGKAAGLSAECFPDAVFGPMPQLYPFIVNDPGEGTQAKRRTGAVIIDHLTPPLTRAESYGPLRDLEALVDEYYQAQSLDPRRAEALGRRILEVTQSNGLDADAGILGEDGPAALQKLDNWLCELKEAQIRDGLHIFGESPTGRLATDLLAALTRLPRRAGLGGDASLTRALAADLGLSFDPLTATLSDPWTGPRPASLASPESWRSTGDTVERLEHLATALIEGTTAPPGPASAAVMAELRHSIRPALQACGPDEIGNLLKGLAGRFIPPGPSGAPTRGRLDVLPTGRNFFSLDNRTLPTPMAWTLGEASARELLVRHFQDHGTYPASIGLSAWGTSNMRTGGDDIAQALALIGAKPVWEQASWRVTGFEILPLAALGRPRMDVTLRISGFFRDAFPAQIELLDRAMRAVGAIDAEGEDNPIAMRMQAEAAELTAAGTPEREAKHLAGQRIFGSKPGAYGAGLQALIDEKLWHERADLARAYVTWGAYAYGAADHGAPAAESFTRRLARIEAVVHNQDNREHDLLDSDDYYQFEGGMTAAVEAASGTRPGVWHNDHSRPERPVIRSLEEEIARVIRSRVVNPKWIAGVKRHGYKGAFEMAATVDYMFAFAATTGAVKSHHFDLAYDAYLGDEATRAFLATNNPAALKEMADRFSEALARGLWTARSNSAYDELRALTTGKDPGP